MDGRKSGVGPVLQQRDGPKILISRRVRAIDTASACCMYTRCMRCSSTTAWQPGIMAGYYVPGTGIIYRKSATSHHTTPPSATDRIKTSQVKRSSQARSHKVLSEVKPGQKQHQTTKWPYVELWTSVSSNPLMRATTPNASAHLYERLSRQRGKYLNASNKNKTQIIHTINTTVINLILVYTNANFTPH